LTYSLAVANGDLVLTGNELKIVTGRDKLIQDLTLWLLVRWGSSVAHPAFGSALQSFIGGVVNSATQANVYNEVIRVLTNYQTMILQLFKTNPQLYTLAELPASVDDVNVSISYDTVYLSVQVSNPVTTANVTLSPTTL
jgi:phage baseplate assembly protein W